jgi:hypothetical protein
MIVNMAAIDINDKTDAQATPAAAPSGSPTSVTPDADRQFEVMTVAAYGPPVMRLPSGRAILNLATMARLLAYHLKLVWNTSVHEFQILSSDQPPIVVSNERMTGLINGTMQKIAAMHTDFPANELRPARIRKLVETIRATAPRRGSDAQETLLRFVREQVVLKPGDSISATAFFEAHLRFCHQHHLPVLSRYRFDRELARVMSKLFMKTASHSIVDPAKGTNIRGYKGVKFVEGLIEARDVGDGRDSIFTSEIPGNPS